MAKCVVCGVNERHIHNGHEFALCSDCAWNAILEVVGLPTSQRSPTTRAVEPAEHKAPCIEDLHRLHRDLFPEHEYCFDCGAALYERSAVN
jgi:hypothetical protein